MPESHSSRGARRGRHLLAELGVELRNARLSAGLPLTAVAAAGDVSPSEPIRIERGLASWLDILVAARLCAIVGLDLAVRAYPGGDPLDSATVLGALRAGRLPTHGGITFLRPIAVGRQQRRKSAA